MVGRGLRAGVSTPVLDRHLITTPIKLPTRTSGSAGRSRPSPSHSNQNYGSPMATGNESPLRFPSSRNRSTSPNRTKTTTPAALTGSTPTRSRLSSYSRTRSGEGRETQPSAVLADRYEEDVGEAVCDYDTNATVLYELLESSSWERARSRCRSHPDEVKTWIIRKDKSLQVRWKLLPLHAAIIFQAPNFLVSTLLEKYAGAASRKDDQGMLPLHLAFRHKQEDEDLLELLLVHYPKAVLIKDRRDRVPLEHGRESKFSAKLMRLYADATVTGSRAMNSHLKSDDVANDDIQKNPGHLSGGQRAILEAEYKEKILAVKVDYEKQIRKMKAQLTDQLAESDQKSKEYLLEVKEEYEKEIRKIKDANDRRLASVHDHHQSNIRQLELSFDEERQALTDQHNEEVSGLRQILANQAAKEKGLTDSLEKEIAHLQIGLQERRTECEVARGQYDQLQGYTNELRDVLQRTTNYQLQLQEMFTKQQEEIESHRLSRYKLVQTLLRQEDDFGEVEQTQSIKITEICDRVRRKVDYAREKGMLPENDEHGDTQSQKRLDRADRHYTDRVEPRIDSRMDRERDEEEPRFSAEKQERLRDEVERERLVHSHLDRDHFHEAPVDSRNDHSYKGKRLTEKNQEQEYGEVRILADEISAITENSDF